MQTCPMIMVTTMYHHTVLRGGPTILPKDIANHSIMITSKFRASFFNAYPKLHLETLEKANTSLSNETTNTGLICLHDVHI